MKLSKTLFTINVFYLRPKELETAYKDSFNRVIQTNFKLSKDVNKKVRYSIQMEQLGHIWQRLKPSKEILQEYFK